MVRKTIVSVLLILFISFHICIAVRFAVVSYNVTISEPDVSAFYYAANVVLDPNIPNAAAYNSDTMYQVSPGYGISLPPMPFVYSIASAYLMSPLTLIPYNVAKLVWSNLSLLMYITAVTIVLYIGGTTSIKRMIYLALLLVWLPFVYSQFWLQSNALLILLIALATLSAVKKRPAIAGIFIGIASLFKIFPLALAVLLGLRNWRIFIACAVLFSASFLIPGSTEWFSAIQKIHIYGISKININPPTNFWLNQLGPILFVVFAAMISGMTALVIFLNKAADYPALVSLAIPSAFLISPLVDYHHLTMLALSYSYILSRAENLPRWFLAASAISFLFVNAAVLYYPFVNPVSLVVMSGVLLIWVSFCILLLPKSNYAVLMKNK